MHKYAQTIPQLNNQMRKAGFSDDDQAAVVSAYLFAAELFSGYFRGCGKTFIAHLVGTASILVAHGASIHAVLAGLLHAAYDQGDFGHRLRRGRSRKVEEMTRTVGAEAERLVAGYHHLPWDAAAISAYASQIQPESDTQRTLLFMRLANELDEHLDGSPLYCRNKNNRLERIKEVGPEVVALANKLGHAELAIELQETFADCMAQNIASTIPIPRANSHLIPPRSFRRRYDSRLRAMVGRIRRKAMAVHSG